MCAMSFEYHSVLKAWTKMWEMRLQFDFYANPPLLKNFPYSGKDLAEIMQWAHRLGMAAAGTPFVEDDTFCASPIQSPHEARLLEMQPPSFHATRARIYKLTTKLGLLHLEASYDHQLILNWLHEIKFTLKPRAKYMSRSPISDEDLDYLFRISRILETGTDAECHREYVAKLAGILRPWLTDVAGAKTPMEHIAILEKQIGETAAVVERIKRYQVFDPAEELKPIHEDFREVEWLRTLEKRNWKHPEYTLAPLWYGPENAPTLEEDNSDASEYDARKVCINSAYVRHPDPHDPQAQDELVSVPHLIAVTEAHAIRIKELKEEDAKGDGKGEMWHFLGCSVM